MSLFRAECSRLLWVAFLLALVHFGALIFLSRMVDLAQQTLAVYWSFAALYALCGALMGFAQFQAYARANSWLGLLHRPLPVWQIAGSLLGAGVLLLALSVAIPILLTALWQHSLSARVVDARHWLLAFASWQIAVCAYFSGVFAALAPRRYALTGLVLLFWLINARAPGPAALVLQMLALLWALWMVAAIFKANRDAPPQPSSVAAVALPLSLGVYFLTLIAFSAIEMLWLAWGTHPASAQPPRGGHIEMLEASGSERMLAAFGASAHSDFALLKEQVNLSEPVSISPGLSRIPHWQELTNVMPMEFDDQRRGVRFVFSHNDARLHGYRPRDGGRDAVLEQVFADPPLPFGRLPGMHPGDAVLVARGRAYHYESASQTIALRVELPGGEWLTTIAPVGESLAIISNRALYIFDVRAFIATREVVTPRARLPWSGPYGALSAVELIELVDGHLVVATFAESANHADAAAPFQTAEILRSDGQVQAINRRALQFDFGWLYRYQAMWLSPTLYALRERALRLFAADEPLSTSNPEPAPTAALILAAVLMVISAVLAFVWLRAHSPRRRLLWSIACVIFGMPMFAALCLIEREREVGK